MKLLYSILGFLFSLSNSNCQNICIGDINDDNIVDVNDLLGVLSRFNENGGLSEDVDNNNIVDVNDILITLSNYGSSCNDEEIVCHQNNDCGGQIWTDCGTSCPLICSEPTPMICNSMCNIGYQCPLNLWWDREVSECVEMNECQTTLPPDLAIGRPYITKINSNICLSNSIIKLNDWTKFNI